MSGVFYFKIETCWDKRTQDSSTLSDDSETGSAVTPTRKGIGGGADVLLTPGTEPDTPEAVAPRVSLSTRADSLPFPKELLFGGGDEDEPLVKEEAPFGLEKALRSIPPIGYVLGAILVILFANASLGSMEQPEDVSDTIIADIVVDSEDPLASSVSDFFQGLVIRDDGSSRIQVLHPRIILALPVVVIHSIQSFFRLLIGAATPNIAGRKGPGVRGGRQTQVQTPPEPKTSESPEGDKEPRFRPGGFLRRLGRPKQVVDSP